MEKIINEIGRTCTKCGYFKEWSCFHIANREPTGHLAQCITCRRIVNKNTKIYIIDSEGRECTSCNTYKKWKYFHKDKNCTKGHRTVCKDCVKEYQLQNKEKISITRKEYIKNNKEKINKSRKRYINNNKEKIKKREKEYLLRNKDKIREREKKYYNTLANYETFVHQLTPFESPREAEEGKLEVKCATCRKYFTPTNRRIKARVNALRGYIGGECRLYCSDSCKEACSVYRKQKYPKEFTKPSKREYGAEFRQMILERDDYTCQLCDTKFETKYLQAHHISPVVCSPMEQVDIDNGICVCKECHKQLHSLDGCSYEELRKAG